MANKNPKRGPRPQFGPAATTPKQLAIRQAARTERPLTLAEWRQRAERAEAAIEAVREWAFQEELDHQDDIGYDNHGALVLRLLP